MHYLHLAPVCAYAATCVDAHGAMHSGLAVVERFRLSCFWVCCWSSASCTAQQKLLSLYMHVGLCPHGMQSWICCYTFPWFGIGAASTSALSEVPASLQEHCVAALLRLHKKQIMRLRSPEDFIQVQLD